MRRRSCTLYAENVEDYTAMAVESFHQPQLYNAKRSSKQSDDTKMELDNASFWEDFDFQDNLPSGKNSKIPTLESVDHQRSSDVETDYTDCMYDLSPKKSACSVTKRFMVLGQTSAGAYALIDSSFGSNDDLRLMPLNQTMDLIIKKEEEEGIHCHFWLKALEDSRFNSLVKVYYKCASVFIFVYSTSDRQSFELVEQAIQDVMRELPKEKFVGILLGNRINSEENREISFEEGASLREKYSLAHFDETYQGDASIKDKILNPFGLFF